MLKSLHIGRYATKPEEFRRLVAFFEAIGFEPLAGAERRSAVLTAPVGMLSLNQLSPKYPREVLARLKDVAQLIVVEVTNPDNVFAIAEKMKLKVLSDSVSAATGERSFSLDSYSALKPNADGRGYTQTHSTIKFYPDGEPTYETVRSDVMKALEHPSGGISSTTSLNSTTPETTSPKQK